MNSLVLYVPVVILQGENYSEVSPQSPESLQESFSLSV